MTEKGKFYLGTKKLSFGQWLEAIDDGCKGDVLALYGLSVLTDVHTYIHLHNNQFWSTLKYTLGTHEETIKMCSKHLLYLGHGPFVELSSRKEPLKILPNQDPNMQSLVIRELTPLEQREYDDICNTNSGNSKSHCHVSVSAGSAKDIPRVTIELQPHPVTPPLDLSLPSKSDTTPNISPYQPLDLSQHIGATKPSSRDQTETHDQGTLHHPSPTVKQHPRLVKSSDKLKWKADVKLIKIDIQPGKHIKLSQDEIKKLQSTMATQGITVSNIEEDTKNKSEAYDSEASTILYSWVDSSVLHVNDPTD